MAQRSGPTPLPSRGAPHPFPRRSAQVEIGTVRRHGARTAPGRPYSVRSRPPALVRAEAHQKLAPGAAGAVSAPRGVAPQPAAPQPAAWHTSLAPTARRGLSGRVCRSRRARDRSHVVPVPRPNLPCGSATSAAPFAARAGAPALDLCRTAHSSERRAALWQPPGRDPSDPSVHAPAYEPDRAPVRSRAPHARWAGIPTVLRRSCAGPAQNMSSEQAQRT